MPNSYFKFKEFSVNQDRCAMKVGTDGVLLGAWSNISNVKNILDIGTGTGLISLMLAQRSNAIIDSIEIDMDAFIQASENFKESKWKERLNPHFCSLQNYLPENLRYDLIVSNPPYFSNSFKPNAFSRTVARHTESLSFDTLITHGAGLLKENGRLSVIIPFESGIAFIEVAKKEKLFLKRYCEVKPSFDKSPKRVLLDFQLNYSGNIAEDSLNIEGEKRHQYTSEYRALTKDYYLKF